jgi:hypothetical protein
MRENIGDFNKFKTQILLCGIVFASVIWVASLLVLGPNLEFVYGLVLGTCICIVNFNVLVLAGKKALDTRKPVFGYAGYLIRLCIYGTAFYMALKVGLLSGIGAVLGFFTLTMSIFSIHMIKPALMGRKNVSEINATKEALMALSDGALPDGDKNTGDMVQSVNCGQANEAMGSDNGAALYGTSTQINSAQLTGNNKPDSIEQNTGLETKDKKWNTDFDDLDEKKKRGRLYRFRKEVFGYAFEDDDKESEGK